MPRSSSFSPRKVSASSSPLFQQSEDLLGVGQYLPRDNNNIAPRLGFSWDPFKSGKTVLRGSYGIYYGHPLTALSFLADIVDGADSPGAAARHATDPSGPARNTFCPRHLASPQGKEKLGPLSLWAVLAQEIDAPDGVEPLCWMLLTTCWVDSFQAACEKLRWYTLRWGIEVYHRTLKSGCRIEQRQLGSTDSLEACLAIDLVVGWRIFHLAKLGREIPDVPCTVYFEEAEWKALVAYVRQTPVSPVQPPTLREAIRMVASLGGFLGRKGDGEPGTQTLWLGLQRLDDIAAMWKLLIPQIHSPPVSSRRYG